LKQHLVGAAIPEDTGSSLVDSGNLGLSFPSLEKFSPVQGAGSDTPVAFGTVSSIRDNLVPNGMIGG
jgi:hypothetical protein